jgi:YD repeat-containing protein
LGVAPSTVNSPTCGGGAAVTEQQKESDGSTSTTTKTWTYDNLLRLIGEAVSSSISANSYTDTYSYDLVGNRLSKTDTQTATAPPGIVEQI